MGRPTFVLDCSALPEAGLGQVDGLACLRLRLRRRGEGLCLVNADATLRELIDLAGLARVLGVESSRKAEEGEEPGGVEEEGELGDPPV
jgi:anti-anti-sigma regulatory factor